MKKIFKRLVSSALAIALLTGSFVHSGGGGVLPYTAFGLTDAFAADNPIFKQGGWLESAYAEWSAVDNASGFAAYIKGGNYSDWTQVDDELIRRYPSYFRVDVLGLKAGSYQIKIVPYINDVLTESKAFTTDTLTVTAHDRSGAAFSSKSDYQVPGAYNADGTLKSGAKVIYVTADNASTVTADIITSSKGAVTTFKGFQNIIYGKQKGYDTTPLDIRIIGTITADDMDSFGSSAEGIQVKGKSAYSEMNITIEGVGEDAAVQGFGFLIRNSSSVEFRNFALMAFMDDGLSLDTDNSNIWIHNMDVFYGSTGGDSDQAKGDGSMDVKGDSKFVTFSYNHFWDSGKSSLCGMKSESASSHITYHHNWFDHSDSRHPRIRTMSVHVYNNYFDGNAKYGVGVTMGSSAYVERNYFNDCKYPMMSSLQGTDAKGDGTFSGETGGIIKAYNNTIVGGNKPIYYSDSTSCDAYLVTSPSTTVPSSVKTVSGGTTYNNFDTDTSNFDLAVKSYTDVANVPNVVMAYAGRINGGDFPGASKSNYTAMTSASYYAVDADFKSAIVNYKSSLEFVGGRKCGGKELQTTLSTTSTTTFTTTTEVSTESTTLDPDASTESTTEPTTQTVTVNYDNGYNFSGIKGSLVAKDDIPSGYTGAYCVVSSEATAGGANRVDLGGGTATLIDTDGDGTNGRTTTLVLPVGTFNKDSGTVTVSGTMTPDTKTSNWTLLQLHGANWTSGKTELLGIRTIKSGSTVYYGYRTDGGLDSSAVKSLGVEFTTDPVSYKIEIDMANKTAKITLGSTTSNVISLAGSDTSTFTSIQFTTATKTQRSIAVGKITVSSDGAAVTDATGDVYKDGAIDDVDAVYLLRYLADINVNSAKFTLSEANANKDSAVDILDVIYILGNKSESGSGGGESGGGESGGGETSDGLAAGSYGPSDLYASDYFYVASGSPEYSAKTIKTKSSASFAVQVGVTGTMTITFSNKAPIVYDGSTELTYSGSSSPYTYNVEAGKTYTITGSDAKSNTNITKIVITAS